MALSYAATTPSDSLDLGGQASWAFGAGAAKVVPGALVTDVCAHTESAANEHHRKRVGFALAQSTFLSCIAMMAVNANFMSYLVGAKNTTQEFTQNKVGTELKTVA